MLALALVSEHDLDHALSELRAEVMDCGVTMTPGKFSSATYCYTTQHQMVVLRSMSQWIALLLNGPNGKNVRSVAEKDSRFVQDRWQQKHPTEEQDAMVPCNLFSLAPRRLVKQRKRQIAFGMIGANGVLAPSALGRASGHVRFDK